MLPAKVLKGPRQVGKTSLLEHLGYGEVIYLDDPATRRFAQQDPRTFLDQYPSTLILDEAARAPELFIEIKRRVDEQRRKKNKKEIDYWITGSNQTLLRKNVSESLAGRASFFDLNTLSVHEIGLLDLESHTFRGGWPELRANPELDPIRYLTDLIISFVERDIVAAAGIEKVGAFNQVLALNAGRIGQLYIPSEIAQLCSVDITTVQSWNNLLTLNGLITLVPPYFSNLNKRLIKTSKLYFQDVALATRLQGWTEYKPLFTSPAMGSIFENIVFSELHRAFINRGMTPKIFHVRSKEKVEIDFLVELPNQKFIALEAKLTPSDFTSQQKKLLDSLNLNIVGNFLVSPTIGPHLANSTNIKVDQIWDLF